MIVQSWPRKRNTRSEAQLAQEAEFKVLVQALKEQPADVMLAAREIAANSKYTWRDILSLAMVGRLISFSNYGAMVAQYNLDILTEVPGSIVVRGPNEWIGLGPGTNTQLLEMRDGLPTWQDKTAPAASGIVGCLVRKNGNQTLLAATMTDLTPWTLTDGYDQAGIFVPATPDRLVVPSGYAWARASLGIQSSSDSNRTAVDITKNSSSVYPGYRMMKTIGDRNIVQTAWVPVVAGDYFKPRAFLYTASATIQGNTNTTFALECRN